MKKIFRLGTRGSPLALIQAQIVRDALLSVLDPVYRDSEIQIVPIRTSGDWQPSHKEQSFAEMGGTKGLFTKEIEDALLTNVIDCAVHSMKDVSVHVPKGLTFAAILERSDPRDAFLSPIAPHFDELPRGARVGTSSLRRKAQLLAARPDLTVIPLRGNVDTRMRKLAAEEADATILAVAGLARLGVLDRAASIFETKVMLPAAAQGFLGIQVREDDAEMTAWARRANHAQSEACLKCERALLRVLDGSCRTPIAAMAQNKGEGTLHLEALVAKPDGTKVIRRTLTGSTNDPEVLGGDLGVSMKKEIPDDFFVT